MNPNLQEKANNLKKAIRTKDISELELELHNQLKSRICKITSVIRVFDNCSYHRDLEDPPVIWEKGSTRLFEYGEDLPKNAPAILVIPSLINKSYILDISKKRSFLRHLKEQGIRSYLVDWQEPEKHELSFNLEDYITKRLEPILDFVFKRFHNKIFLAGYCIGGLMAIALANRCQEKLHGLALLATPYDFHAKDFSRVSLDARSIRILEDNLKLSEKIPAYTIQSIFYYLYMDIIEQKFNDLFEKFEEQNNDDLEESIAIEHWVNDGISMTRNVAKECFIDWINNNQIINGDWKIKGKTIKISEIKIPTFFLLAENDHIVPRSSTEPLINTIKDKTVVTHKGGHVSIVAGKNTKETSWKKFVEWIYSKKQ